MLAARPGRIRLGVRAAGVLSIITALIATFAVSAPAQADVWVQGMVRSMPTGRCLDSNGAGNVYTLPCDPNGGNPYQQWEYHTVGGSYDNWQYQIVNLRTRRCLDSNWAGNLYTSPCQSGNGWQTWYVHFSDAPENTWGHIFQMRDLVTNRCVDANQPQYLPYTNGCGSNYQDWHWGF
jgi:serine/threonine-protein kinase